jgi:hypothetical protein
VVSVTTRAATSAPSGGMRDGRVLWDCQNFCVRAMG